MLVTRSQGDFHHIWRFQILMAAILDFLPRGLPMILGQNFTFPLSLCTVKSDLEMMFGDGVECVQGHFHHIWRFQILMVAILDFLPRGLPMILGQNVTFLLRLGSHLRQTFEMSEDIADNFVSELV